MVPFSPGKRSLRSFQFGIALAAHGRRPTYKLLSVHNSVLSCVPLPSMRRRSPQTMICGEANLRRRARSRYRLRSCKSKACSSDAALPIRGRWSAVPLAPGEVWERGMHWVITRTKNWWSDEEAETTPALPRLDLKRRGEAWRQGLTFDDSPSFQMPPLAVL